MRLRPSILCGALAAFLLPTVSTSAATCAQRKVVAVGRACSDTLRSEARLARDGDASRHQRRVARTGERLREDWSSADASGDGACTSSTATGSAAAERLAAAASEAAALLAGSPACRSAVLSAVAPLCRPLGSAEAALLGDGPHARARWQRTVQDVRRRLAAHFPSAACRGGATLADAESTLLAVAAGALGDATTRGLRELGAAAGLEIGTAVEPVEVVSDPAYAAALERDTSSVTAENAMKWGPIHPAPDSWAFDAADAVIALADAGGLRVRGHNLVWGALQLPSYVESAPDADALRRLMQEHIATVAGRWAGRIAQWDVVNEPLAGVLDPPTTDGLDDNVFRRLLGPGYVAEALHLAHAADPAAKLFVNENGIEVPGPRQDRFYALVKELLASGAPLHGVGFQAHFGLIPVGQYPDEATIAASLRRFADLGLTVELTELDVTLVFRPGDLPSRLAFQGRYYRSAVAACAALPACSGVTTWGLSDRSTWLRSFFGFTDWPLPFDDDWNRKAAYFGMRAALIEASMRAVD